MMCERGRALAPHKRVDWAHDDTVVGWGVVMLAGVRR
jgi:hypothetical protein